MLILFKTETYTMTYEEQFLNALKSIFIGAKVEGESGYINLMKIKASYFEKGVFPQLMKDIDAACKPFEKGFREELFDKLHDFFQHYFSESGSIYFRNTAQHHNIYEKVYTDDQLRAARSTPPDLHRHHHCHRNFLSGVGDDRRLAFPAHLDGLLTAAHA